MIDIPDSMLPKNEKGECLCPKCAALIPMCTCPVQQNEQHKKLRVTPHIRLEKSGRKGKTVTIIGGLPNDKTFLQKLTKSLKIKTGCGGTYYIENNIGIIEIQGDHRKALGMIDFSEY